MASNELPLVSVEVLRDLEDSLEGQGQQSRAFVCRYVRLWPARFDRIHSAVAAARSDEAIEATLSLYAASSMAGALRLSGQAAQLIQLLKGRQWLRAAQELEDLQGCGNHTAAALTAIYLCPTP